MEGRTFTINCKGVVGDMLNIEQGFTGKETAGLNIAEAEIYGRG